MVRSSTRVAIMVLTVMVVASSSCSSSSSPRVSPDADTVIGSVWLDDGDGVSGGDADQPADGLEIRVGTGSTVLTQDPVVTDQDGQFSISQNRLQKAESVFVEVSFDTPGPTGDGSSRAQLRVPVQPPSLESVDIALPRVALCRASLTALRRADAGPCGRPLLPDLVPIVSSDLVQAPAVVGAASTWVDTTSVAGRTVLRLGSATANLGEGPLHMIPDTTSTDGRLTTWQRIWTDSNQLIDHQTGEFVFHPGHDHFHLDGFEQYRLLSLDGQVLVVGEKISFCLIDSVATSDARPRQGLGVFPATACEDAGDQQALNVGWADYYGPTLDDQWIDITGIEPGDYIVEIIVDPDDILIEADETNNRATFDINISAEDLRRS